jgi:hypothetical protein
MLYSKLTVAYDKVQEIIEAYQPHLGELSHSVQPKVVREEYGVGGACFHRGFYCPSIVMDLIIGNATRGRAQKTKPKNGRLVRTFGFDENNELILVNNPDRTEYIFRAAQSEVGVTVDHYGGMNRISEISVCTYEYGRISSYIYALCGFYEDPPRKRIIELNVEDYQYGTDALIVNRYCKWEFHNNSCKHKRYTFAIHDGYLTSYTVEDFDPNGIVRPFWKDHVFSVDVKRKIK